MNALWAIFDNMHQLWRALTWRRIIFLSKTMWNGNALQKVNGLILFSNDINWSKLIWSFSGSVTEMLLMRSLISNWTWSQSSPFRLIIFTSTSWPCNLLATACKNGHIAHPKYYLREHVPRVANVYYNQSLGIDWSTLDLHINSLFAKHPYFRRAGDFSSLGKYFFVY